MEWNFSATENSSSAWGRLVRWAGNLKRALAVQQSKSRRLVERGDCTIPASGQVSRGGLRTLRPHERGLNRNVTSRLSHKGEVGPEGISVLVSHSIFEVLTALLRRGKPVEHEGREQRAGQNAQNSDRGANPGDGHEHVGKHARRRGCEPDGETGQVRPGHLESPDTKEGRRLVGRGGEVSRDECRRSGVGSSSASPSC